MQNKRLLHQRFNRLAETWHQECDHLSSIEERVNHYAYQQIIGMGPAALPLILDELEQRPDHWFHALRAIIGEDPVRQQNRGRVREMARDWLEWGRVQGLLRPGGSISHTEALRIAGDILERAERERIEFAEREQGIGEGEECGS